MMHLHHLAEELRKKALGGLEAFDAAWAEGGMPKALELHGEDVIRAQVAYQAALDLEAVLRGACAIDDVLRDLESAAHEPPSPRSRMGLVAWTIAKEEAMLILGKVRGSLENWGIPQRFCHQLQID
jgi:hypothetical protein